MLTIAFYFALPLLQYPAKDFAGKRNVPNNKIMNLGDSTRNFFNVAWLSEPALPVDSAGCEGIAGCYSVIDGCVCNTITTETPAFTGAEEISSKADILSALKVGAFDPSQIDSINELGSCGVQGVSFYSQTLGESCSNFGPDVIVSYIDNQGAQKYLKNIQSVVTIDGLGDSFRNPPHFISMVDPDKRDMYYEMDAVINHFFYNPTHAPFLAIRIIQRFGISNPTPGFIERVSTAYATGSYKGIGSGSYGDLSAMVAAVLLDDESRSTTLDADPSHGQTREPLLKVLAFLKALAVNYTGPSGPHGLNGKLRRLGIGQDSYGSPSVFSFFLPEYQPSGPVEKANLVSPESQVLAGKKVTTLIDGLFTTVKFGMTDCYRGFGKKTSFNKCPEQEGSTKDAIGLLDYTPPDGASMDEVLDDLSLLLTAKRLGATNTEIIRSAMKDAYDTGDEAKGIRIAQQLIASTPEFHSWGTVHHNSGTPRKIEGYTEKSEKKYKNVVFFFMAGGVDSYNLVVPVGGCGNNKNLYEEYATARGDHAIQKEKLNSITTAGQPCSEWGINNHFPILQDLYNDGDALFMLNMGILSKPLTKHDDWMRESNIILFAHNHMSKEQMLLDPFRQNSGTGVGGRMLDILKRNGYQTSGSTVDGDVLLMQGDSYYANPTTTIATGEIEELDQNSTLAKNEMFVSKLFDCWTERSIQKAHIVLLQSSLNLTYAACPFFPLLS
jgi:cullin-associated NEDD8-dissociated protein 1